MRTYIFETDQKDYSFEIEANSYLEATMKAFESYGPQAHDMNCTVKDDETVTEIKSFEGDQGAMMGKSF